ncbi:MAG: T9SS type A sorting domain-containing protein [bacterium]
MTKLTASDGKFSDAFGWSVSISGNFDVTLYLMAPIYGTGNFIMDIFAEGTLIFDDLDVETEAGGTFQSLIQSFTANVNDGTLDIDFQMVNKAVLVSTIAVVQQSAAPDLAKPTADEIQMNSLQPQGLALFQNYPNPFNPETNIRYSLPEAMYVRLVVYNSLGQEVSVLVDGFQQAGTKKVIWNGKSQSGIALHSGIYFYKLITKNHILTRQFTLLK